MALFPVTSALLKNIPTIRHGFFGRRGGVSEGMFASLNTGRHKGDSEENVLENRKRVAEALEASVENLLIVVQKHTADVKIATSSWSYDEAPIADALVTTIPGLLLTVQTADCVPILISDQTGCVIAAVHAGWKGTSQNIIGNTIKKMNELGALNNSLIAAIGPCIWQDNYQVGLEFRDHFSAFPQFLKEKEKNLYLDLPGCIKYQLLEAGVKYISESTANTYTDEEFFFSYRRSTHRQETQFGSNMCGIVRI